MSTGTINMKVDTSALQAAIEAEILRMDQLGEKAANQLMLEGVNAAQALCRKDTGALNDSIAASSSVVRISPAAFSIVLANGVDYGTFQELGPSSGKRVWAFSPHIRPGAAIMQAKAQEVCERVFQ